MKLYLRANKVTDADGDQRELNKSDNKWEYKKFPRYLTIVY